MNLYLYSAVALTVLIGLAHSFLGEKYILVRLFRREDLPKLFGGTEFTKRTLRFAWHLNTIAWFGLGAVMVLLARPELNRQHIGLVIAVTFLIHGLVALIASKAKHLAWIVFLAIAALVWVWVGVSG